MEPIVRMQADIQQGTERTYVLYDIIEVIVFSHFTRLVFEPGVETYVANGDVLSITPYIDYK